MSVELFLGLWGAIVSTVLAGLKIFQYLQDKPRIEVDANFFTTPSSEDEQTHGVLIQVQRGDDLLWEEADVELTIRNIGRASIQITSFFVETDSHIHQVIPDGVPVTLDPNTQQKVVVQPEWFAQASPVECNGEVILEEEDPVSAGVLDARGDKHKLTQDNLKEIVSKCRDLPLRRRLYRHKETDNIVGAFQTKDPSRLIKKEK